MYWVPIERGFLIIRKEGANPVLIELTEMLINLACVFIALIDKCFSNDSYFVSLKASESIDHFMEYDKRYPKHLQVRDFISNSIAIGDFKGFSGRFSKDIIDRLKRCPLVQEITEDIMFNALDFEIQEDAPRHLARISRRRRMKPNKPYPYMYETEYSGQGVNAYVIDSGIEVDHPEFEGRASAGYDFTEEGSGDNNGHGTHVAGLIGSVTYGVAKNVRIVEVKALNSKGAGSLSTILAAIDFAVNHRIESGRKGVANLSLGAYKNHILNKAIEQATNTGLVFVVAAGNSNINACMTSPASSKYAITVGAIDDYTDSVTAFSNWGECVDIFASGAYVRSVDARNHDKTQVLSGTSMASPIVTGMVANLLSQNVESGKIKSVLIRMAAKNKITKTSLFLRKKTPNRILYNGIQEREIEYNEDD
ncbi:subtilase-type proteinase RRT12 [Candida albicans GC75]|nr:subtilase-type proteinase RRT12 [Candida albicans GC75]KGU23675.1 subtilase-type proteinase RRT12 [Candida albicans P75063]KHC61109.1 subtilase-type proteinase RRT12 [Candida albicans P75016]